MEIINGMQHTQLFFREEGGEMSDLTDDIENDAIRRGEDDLIWPDDEEVRDGQGGEDNG